MARTPRGSHMQEALGYYYLYVLWHVLLPANWLDLRLHATLKEVQQAAARH